MSHSFVISQRYSQQVNISHCRGVHNYNLLLLQHHRGRGPRQDAWVFGLVDTSHTPALGYMEVVQTRDARTLLPIIQAHVAPGTVVHSDQWRAYSQVANLPSVLNHQTVNHSINFVDPTTGVHTQHVESYWNRVKVKLKHMRGCHSQNIPQYLDEFMWRERHGKTGQLAFTNILRDIAQQYPV